MPSQSNQYTQKICTYKKAGKLLLNPRTPKWKDVHRISIFHLSTSCLTPFPTWSSRRSSINFASRFSLSFIVSKTASLGWLSISRGWEEKISCKSGTIFLCFGLLMVCVCHPPNFSSPFPVRGELLYFEFVYRNFSLVFFRDVSAGKIGLFAFFSRGVFSLISD